MQRRSPGLPGEWARDGLLATHVRPLLWTLGALLRRFSRSGGPLMVGSALLAAVALAGVIDRLAGDLSPGRTIGLALALVLLGVLLLRRRRTVRILPFRNLAKGAGPADLDPLAAALAEQLHIELRRIRRLRAGSTISLVQEAYRRGPPGPARGLGGPRVSEKLRPGQPPSGPDVAGADIATLTVGPLRLQLGWLVALISRSTAKVVTGSVFLDGDEVVAVAEHPGGVRWSTRCALDAQNPTRNLSPLARALAAKVAWHFEPPETSGGDWQALAATVDGLEHYERYRRVPSMDCLADAEAAFASTVRRFPGFSFAYYCLGLVRSEQARITNSDPAAAFALWERAALLDPTFADAQLMPAVQRISGATPSSDGVAPGDLGVLERRCRQAVALRHQARGSTAAARYVLADVLFHRALLENRPTDSTCRTALRELRIAERELRVTRRVERLGGALEPDLAGIDFDLALIAAARGEVHEWLIWHSSSSDQRRRAERAFRRAVRVRPDQAEHRARLALVLADGTNASLAFEQVSRALHLDPWAPVARQALAKALQRDPGGRDTAMKVALSALDAEPWDAREWLLAAELASSAHPAAAVELAGCALALAPYDPLCHDLIAGCLANLDEPGWANAFWHVAHDMWDALGSPPDAAGEHSSRTDDERRLTEMVEAWTRAWSNGDVEEIERLAPALPRVSTLTANQLGRLLRFTERTDDARLWFQRALDRFHDSDVAATFELPVPVEWRMDLADGLLDTECWEEASAQYEAILARSEASPLQVSWSGGERSLSLRAESSAPAIIAFASAGRARAALEMGRVKEALELSESAIELDPELAFPYSISAQVFAERLQYDEAVDRWQCFARQAPGRAALADAAIGDLRRKQAYDEADEARRATLFGEAIAAYRRAQAGSPFDVNETWARLNLAESLWETGHRAEARMERDVVARLVDGAAGGDPVLHHTLACAYARDERLAAALQSYRRAVQTGCEAVTEAAARGGAAPVTTLIEASDVCNHLAWFLVEQELSLDEARTVAKKGVRFAEQALAADGGDRQQEALSHALDTLGWVQHRLGRDAAATRSLQRALELSARSTVRAHLAEVLEVRAAEANGNGRAKEHRELARRQWLRIQELDPGSELAAEAKRRLAKRKR